MCVYCAVADWGNKWVPMPQHPFYPTPPPLPYAPINPPPPTNPFAPVGGWTQSMLDEFKDLLARVKALEDRVDPCPCPDESKLDFIKDIQAKLDAIDKKVSK